MKILRLSALLEGLTCIALYLVAMPLKHFVGIEEAVKVPGMIHGIFFIIYIVALLVVYRQKQWPFSTLVIGGIAAIVPFMTFWMDAKYFRER